MPRYFCHLTVKLPLIGGHFLVVTILMIPFCNDAIRTLLTHSLYEIPEYESPPYQAYVVRAWRVRGFKPQSVIQKSTLNTQHT